MMTPMPSIWPRMSQLWGGILLAFAGLSPLTGAAQDARDILVTAGNHAGFTRLVLQNRTPLDWTLTPGPDARSLHLHLPGAVFDLGRAFDRIDRARLADLTPDQTGLILRLGCDCTHVAWQERPGLLVIDIRDPIYPADPMPTAGNDPQPAPINDQVTDSATTERPEITAGISLAQSLRPPMPPPMDLPDAGALLDDLTRSIATGAAQGLLIPDAPLGDSAQGLLAQPLALPSSQTGLRLRSAIAGTEPETSTERNPNCPDPAALDISTWSSTTPFALQQAELMRALVQEFDQTNPEALTSLARLYLAHGLGAETRALIHAFPGQAPETRNLLLGLSDILSDRSSNARQSLASLYDCPPEIDLLAMLARPADAPIRDPAAIATAFAQLPPTLRVALGEEVIRRLLDTSHIESARIAFDALARTQNQSPSILAGLEARIELARGDPLRAWQMAQLADPDADKTRHLFLVLARDHDLPLPPGLPQRLHDDLPMRAHDVDGIQLAVLLGRWYISQGEMDQAFEIIDILSRAHRSSAQDQTEIALLRNDLWAEVARDLPDEPLLRLVLTREDWRNPSLTPATLRALDARLRALGLGDLTRPLLTGARPEPVAGLASVQIPPASPENPAFAQVPEAPASTAPGTEAHSTSLRPPGSGQVPLPSRPQARRLGFGEIDGPSERIGPAPTLESPDVVFEMSVDSLDTVITQDLAPAITPERELPETSSSENPEMSAIFPGLDQGPDMVDPTAAGDDPSQQDATAAAGVERPAQDLAPPIAPPSPRGLLAQGNEALRASAALRADIAALIDNQNDEP